MTRIQQFSAQRGAFETAYESGDWAALGAYFHEDITYEVLNMPFHCVIKGREQVLAGLRLSVERFDKLCIRTVGIDSSIREEGDNVLVHSGIRFERAGAPSTSATLWEIATYRGERIERILDIYDPGCGAEFEQWMSTWGQGLDPRYL
jgi:ketosteroid isomerase-like protein